MSALFFAHVALFFAAIFLVAGALRLGVWWMDRVEAKAVREFLEQQLVAEAAANASRAKSNTHA